MENSEVTKRYSDLLKVGLKGLPFPEQRHIFKQLLEGASEEEAFANRGREPARFSPIKELISFVRLQGEAQMGSTRAEVCASLMLDLDERDARRKLASDETLYALYSSDTNSSPPTSSVAEVEMSKTKVSLEFRQWLSEVENCVSSTVSNCYPRSWQEDYITQRWLEELIDRFKAVTITDLPRPFSVAWDAYKADGPLEEGFGDVAILVRFTLANSAYLDGVAFLEAKRMYTARYDSLGWDQLKHESSEIANHRVLLYDFQPICEHLSNMRGHAYCLECFPSPYDETSAVVIPTQHVIAAADRSRVLHQFSVSLGFQLCTRYLRGLDLDYRAPLIRRVHEGARGGVRFLLVAHVSTTNEVEPNPALLEVSPSYYQRLGESSTGQVAVAFA